MRTTLDLDKPVLDGLKALQKMEKGSLGRIASNLLAEALASRKGPRQSPPQFAWNTKQMRARVDLSDKDAVFQALDES